MATTFASRSARAHPSVEVVLYRDLFCPRCHLVACRLEGLRRAVGPWFGWRIRPFPLRHSALGLDPARIDEALREIEAAWGLGDCPNIAPEYFAIPRSAETGVVAMAAVEAAFFQSRRAGRALDQALRRALFERGGDIGSLQVVMELADAVGSPVLDVARLVRDLRGAKISDWKDRLIDRRGEAIEQGITSAPVVVIGEHMISGVASQEVYGEALFDLLAGAVGNSSTACFRA